MAARRDLGNVTLVQEDTRTLWTWIALEQLAQDVRYGLRTMFKNRDVHRPGRTVARAWDRREHGDLQLHGLHPVALAAGVGPCVAGGGEMAQQTVQLLQIARVRDAQHRRQHLPRPEGITAAIFPFPAFERLQEASAPVLSSIFAYVPAGKSTCMIKGEAELAKGEYVSGDFFRGLAVSPAAGRLILGDDDRAGAPPVAVISMGYSQRRFGGAAEAAGQPILINNVAFTVVGVDAVRVLRRGSRRGARRVSPPARQSPVRPGGRARLPRPELLLAPDDGTAASRR